MFTNISWANYLLTITLLVVIYYLYVGVRYYANDLKDLISGKRKLNFRTSPAGSAGNETPQAAENADTPGNTSFEETTDDGFAEVEYLIGRLKDVIADASGRQLIPQEFKYYLRLTLKEYLNIKTSPLRSSVNELIVTECEKYGAVTLSADEVDMLWNDGV